MLLSAQQIQNVLAQRAISDALPWVTNDKKLVENFYRGLIDKICSITGCLAKVVWNDYGSGYASYIDAWLYKPNDEFSLKGSQSDAEGYTGSRADSSQKERYFLPDARKFQRSHESDRWGAYGIRRAISLGRLTCQIDHSMHREKRVAGVLNAPFSERPEHAQP